MSTSVTQGINTWKGASRSSTRTCSLERCLKRSVTRTRRVSTRSKKKSNEAGNGIRCSSWRPRPSTGGRRRTGHRCRTFRSDRSNPSVRSVRSVRRGGGSPTTRQIRTPPRGHPAVNDWLTVMQSREWLSSQYVVGPIQTSRTPRGDENAQANVDDGGANEAPPHDDFGYDDFGYDDYGGCDDYQCNENAPPNVIQGGVDDGNSGDTVAPPSPEESRAAGLDFGHRIDLDGVKSDWLDRVTQQYTGKPVTHILDAIKDIIQGGGSLESIKTCFDSLAKAFSQAFPGDVLPNLFPTGRELEQLWRRAENTYKSCWTCPNDHDHTDDKSSPCPQCGKRLARNSSRVASQPQNRPNQTADRPLAPGRLM